MWGPNAMHSEAWIQDGSEYGLQDIAYTILLMFPIALLLRRPEKDKSATCTTSVVSVMLKIFEEKVAPKQKSQRVSNAYPKKKGISFVLIKRGSKGTVF
jgi:hypothetical protein